MTEPSAYHQHIIDTGMLPNEPRQPGTPYPTPRQFVVAYRQLRDVIEFLCEFYPERGRDWRWLEAVDDHFCREMTAIRIS